MSASRSPTLLYRAARTLIRVGLSVFYRRIEVTGAEHLDPNAPTIFASTHPNSIVDPLLVGLQDTRQVAFCARDGLFDVPLFGRLLRAVGAIPIARRRDHAGHAVDNREAFVAVRQVLTDRGVVAIFPEGKTHGRLHVQELKTGAARMALDAEQAADFQLGVKIVPVSLNYLVRHAMRSDVHVAFGAPIHARDYQQVADEDPHEAARRITARLSERLREHAVHVEHVEDERLIAQVTTIMVDIRRKEGLDVGGQSPSERIALAKRVVAAYRWLQEVDPERCAALHDRLAAYVDERSRLGLGGETAALQHRRDATQAARQTRTHPRRFSGWLLATPLAAHGLAGSILPYWVVRAALRLIRPRHDRAAFAKLLVGAVIFASGWTLQTLFVTGVLGVPIGVVYGASLFPSALFFLRFSRETNLHRLNLRSMKGRIMGRDRLARLRSERDALRQELTELRQRYLAEVEQTESSV